LKNSVLDRFIDLSEVRAHLGPYYSDVGRPSIDPELMIRILGADGFAVDASLIASDANKQRSVPSKDWKPEEIKESAVRAAREYLATLDDAAFGAASPVTPKFISRSDPAAQWTGVHKGHAFFAYAANYLIDTDHGVIVDVEATRAIRQAEVGAARTMLERTETRFGIKPAFLTADSAHGSADSLAWLVKEKDIAPPIPVFDKSNRTDGTFSRADFETVVSGCDASPILQLAEQACDDVSALIGGGERLEAVEGMAALIFLCLSHRRRLSAS
jgi:hypothetical protein